MMKEHQIKAEKLTNNGQSSKLSIALTKNRMYDIKLISCYLIQGFWCRQVFSLWHPLAHFSILGPIITITQRRFKQSFFVGMSYNWSFYHQVVNLIKHFIIVIYDSIVVLTRNFPILRP